MYTEIKQRIEAANLEAVKRMIAADPVLVDIAPAGEVIPGLANRMIIHSGPPVDWKRICGAQRGACIGLAIVEGWAANPAEAETPGRGRDQARAEPPSSGGGADGRDHRQVPTGFHRGKQGFRQSRILPSGRGQTTVR